MGFNGPVSLNYNSVDFIMDIYNIENRRECFEKVLTLYSAWLERFHKDQEMKGNG